MQNTYNHRTNEQVREMERPLKCGMRIERGCEKWQNLFKANATVKLPWLNRIFGEARADVVSDSQPFSWRPVKIAFMYECVQTRSRDAGYSQHATSFRCTAIVFQLFGNCMQQEHDSFFCLKRPAFCFTI